MTNERKSKTGGEELLQLHQENLKHAAPVLNTVAAVDISKPARQKPIIRHAYNFDLERPGDLEHNSGDSKTVPDQALTVRELLDRQRRGIAIPQFNPIYNGDLDLPDFKTMDLTEREEYIQANAERINNLRTDLSAAQQNARKEQEQKREAKAKDPDSEANPDPKNKEKS